MGSIAAAGPLASWASPRSPGIALAVLTSWPLVLHLSSRIAPDLGDPIRTAWQVAWVGHALFHDPLHVFDSNAFYPHPLSLAFSDSLLGYGPVAWIGTGSVARTTRPLQPAVPVGVVAVLLRHLPVGAGSSASAASPAPAAAVASAYAPYRDHRGRGTCT